MDCLPAGIIVADQKGVILHVNQAAERLSGLSQRQAGIELHRAWSLRDPESGCTVGRLEAPMPRRLLSVCHNDGAAIPVFVTMTRLWPQVCGVSGFVVFLEDPGMLTGAEAVASSEHLRTALTAVRQGVYDLDLRTGRAKVSPEYSRMLGYAPEDLGETHQAWQERLHPEDRDAAMRAFQTYIEGRADEYRAEFRLRTRSGAWKWILSLGSIVARSPEGVPLRMLGTHTDIDERKRAEEEARERETAYLDQRNALIELSARMEPTGSLADVYRRFTETAARTLRVARVSVWLHGDTPDEIVCMDMYDRIADRHSSGDVMSRRGAEAYFTALRTDELIAADDAITDPRTCELAPHYLRPQGITAMLDAPIRLASEVVGVLCHEHIGPPRQFRTDEQTFAVALATLLSLRLEEAQRRKAEAAGRLRIAALEAAANGIVITDVRGRIAYANTAFATITGFAPEEVIGGTPGEFLRSGLHEPAFYEELWATILSGRTWSGRIQNRRKDGTVYTESQTITPVRTDHGEITHFIAIKTDLTERMRIEAQLQQSKKLESLGRLAGGIAHDFNNLLTVINGTAELAMDALSDRDDLRAEWEHVREAGTRAALMTSQLLAFSREQIVDREVLDFHEVVRDMAQLVRRLTPENLAVTFVVCEAPGLVRAGRGQLEQILLNLVVNARDAMAAGGTLTVRTGNVTPRATCPHGCVELQVTDTGVGMTAEVLEHIFEPFFTTKGAQRGTGLGLSTVYGIVQQNGGSVDVASRPGEGSTFTIRLPMTTAQPQAKRQTASHAPANTGQRILVVEDEATVRALTCRILQKAGYEVLAAVDGADAIARLESVAQPVDLVLTDMVMPVMSGPEVAARIAESCPHVRILFTSGYSGEQASDMGVAEMGAFLPKPFTRDSLLTKVAELLSRNG